MTLTGNEGSIIKMLLGDKDDSGCKLMTLQMHGGLRLSQATDKADIYLGSLLRLIEMTLARTSCHLRAGQLDRAHCLSQQRAHGDLLSPHELHT
jgi:hypothetical protein